jgi:Phage integrase family
MEQLIHTAARIPWNKGKLVGQKAPLKFKDIWAIRVRLQICHRTRELALFNLAIAKRAIVIQQKTQRPVQFEITEQTRESLLVWIHRVGLRADDYLFPSRARRSPHLSTRQYARIVRGWVREIGLDVSAYGTHTLRRTKASLIYRRTKNLRGRSVVTRLLLRALTAISGRRDLRWRASGMKRYASLPLSPRTPRYSRHLSAEPAQTPTPSDRSCGDLPRGACQGREATAPSG